MIMINNKEEKDKSAKILVADALSKTVFKKNLRMRKIDFVQADRKEQVPNFLKNLAEDSNDKTN